MRLVEKWYKAINPTVSPGYYALADASYCSSAAAILKFAVTSVDGHYRHVEKNEMWTKLQKKSLVFLVLLFTIN